MRRIVLSEGSRSSKNKSLEIFKQMGRADELGSGTKNLYHYTRLYSNSDHTIEDGDTFITTVPLDDDFSLDKVGVNETIKGTDVPIIKTCETINETINDLDETTNEMIEANQGIGLLDLTSKIGKSRATVARALSRLAKSGRIEYRGSKKTGGYYPL